VPLIGRLIVAGTVHIGLVVCADSVAVLGCRRSAAWQPQHSPRDDVALDF